MAFPIIKLKQVLTESKVEAPSSDSSKRIRVRLHAKGVEKRPEMNEKEGATKYYIRRAGQFVYGRQNLHKGAFGVIPPELDGFQSSSDIPSFDVAARCLPEWVDLFLKQGGFYLELSKLASGVGSQRISPSKFLSLEMPLPSIEQQRAILDQVEFYKVSQSQLLFELTHQQTLLKKLRQQILQEAIEGKLTADWRAQNPDVEPASELLKRIAAEKAQLVKDKKIKAQKPLPPITDEEKPFDLPRGWEWCRLGDIINISSGDGLTSAEMKGGKIPVFGGNGINGYHDSYNTNEATVTIGRVGAYCGAVHLTPVYAWITDNCFRVYFSKNNIKTSYLLLHLKQMNLGESSFKGAQPVISGKRVYPLLTQLPSLQEQQVIVTKVEKLLVLCDQLETQITQNQTHAEQLMQAVLKEAFSHNSEAEPTVKKSKGNG